MREEERIYCTWLSKNLSKKRFAHVLSVVKEAERLARRNGADIEKCRLAALLHDCAKEMPLEEMQKICRREHFEDLSERDLENGEILHGFVASVFVKESFGIQDEEVLEAIRYHTVGKAGMSLVGKIVYIADAIEETRNYPSVDKIRKKTYEDLEQGILMEIEHKLEYLSSTGATLHPNTLEWKKSLEEES
ncbi:hydrolase, HD family [Fusobacterium necrophorum subsp. funduliforme ATCC 51357]|uniref:bis(5'-nucleosyl)-tetraphosphatase (symmetrical) n=1 Tax=Fusobacterium necrophorum subsp. funduliforme TaxID=143387 RepID=A0A161QW16_9FUSO|nr:bis(5'-nucleosyl)-tetraphosphatase (symmetrical) YqeK [Fusobacterium necrophorum]EHO16808.1 hypothetical protein HMPREF9466_02944 [Fusobacterium necrophorum subsp. funduliforme 1_1_36S]AVQ20316.1 HD domain-containing protein [Fusobacterium necrophorum subsp. funduliforme]AYV93911.1 HD domain-containing protein [Fusobacterium necrophorum subsp. funduliforme]EIJ71704.1 hydrolase, HD family [Fusobacterium necrophorum subsp. funduliforme ATCC 51357]KAB0552584.1 HD domain-containing protein [Fus